MTFAKLKPQMAYKLNELLDKELLQDVDREKCDDIYTDTVYDEATELEEDTKSDAGNNAVVIVNNENDNRNLNETFVVEYKANSGSGAESEDDGKYAIEASIV